MPISKIKTEAIEAAAVTTAKVADSAVNSAKIGVDVIAAEDLAANSVTVSELTDGAVTSAKLDTNIDIAGTLDVTGVTTLDDTLTVTGVTTLDDTLTVTGNSKLSNLDVGKTTNLISNGDFTTNTTGWAATTSTLAVVSNELQLTPNTSVNGFANQQVDNLVVGRRYSASITVTSDANNLARLYIGTSANATNTISKMNLGVGTHTVSFVATATTHHFALVVGGGTGQVTRFDNAQLYEAKDVAVSGITTSDGTHSNLELVANGDFSNGTTGWSSYGSTLSVSNGQITVADNGGYSKAYQGVSTVIGQTYEVSVDQVSVTGQHNIVGLGTAEPNSQTWGDIISFSKLSAALPYTQVYKFKATSTTTWISLGSEGNNSAVYDNVSLKKVGMPDNQLIKASELKTEIAGLGLEFDTSGRMINKNQPFYCVKGTGGQSYSTGATILPVTPAEHKNIGDHFDSSTGRFTAPVRGNYFLSFQATAWWSDAQPTDGWQTRLQINGVQFHDFYHAGGAASGYEEFVNPHAVVELLAGDYVDWIMTGYGGTFQFQQQMFIGYLLG
jgi:hypothetical protein